MRRQLGTTKSSLILSILGAALFANTLAAQSCLLDGDRQSVTRISGNGPAYQFTNIREVLLAGGGRTIVVDPRAREIRAFDSTGRFLRNIGRQGDGPTEFRIPGSVALVAPDTIAVLDDNNGKVVVYSIDGSHATDIPLGDALGVRPVPSARWSLAINILGLLGRANQNQWALHAGPTIYPMNPKVGSHRDTAVVINVQPGSTTFRRVATTLTNEVSVVPEIGTSRTMYIGPLLERRSFAALLRSNEVVIADGARQSVTVHNMAGGAPREIPLPFATRRATASAVDAEIAASTVVIGDKASTERYRRATVVAQNLPSVSGLVAADGNWFWVAEWRAATDRERKWHELSSSGARGCSLALPVNATLKAVSGGRVALVVKDSDEVETVEIWKLLRRN